MLMKTTMTTSSSPDFEAAGGVVVSAGIAGLRNTARTEAFDDPGFAVAFAGRATEQRRIDGRDVELVEIRPAEHDAGRQPDRHVDHAFDLAARLEGHDLRAFADRHPQEAVSVDGS